MLDPCCGTSFRLVADKPACELGLLAGDTLNLSMTRFPSGAIKTSLFVVRPRADLSALLTALEDGQIWLVAEDAGRDHELRELLEEASPRRPRLELVKGGAT